MILAKTRTVAGLVFFTALLATSTFIIAQVNYPRASQRQSIEQTIGDTEVRIVYHRPNLNGRTGFGDDGAIVPFGKVWRAGANEATLFEFSNDVAVNGNTLPRGKYSFYVIPGQSEWTVIFNKSWDQWGTVYNEKDDATRFVVTPVVSDASVESLTFSVENVTATTAKIVLSWDKTRLPFAVDIGDLNARLLKAARREMVNDPVNAANYVLANKIEASYAEAVKWLDTSLSLTESYGALFAKSRLLAEMGNKKEAVVTGERALEVGKQANVNTNSLAFLEGLIRSWRTDE